jgi:ribokinase|tara:strand:+ start:2753 stop:3676 length:924 start_codon:yes stop_codon:yes gene_type:complete
MENKYMGKVLVLGVFVADTAYRASRMPKMGETILGNSFVLGPGGKGSNQAVAAGNLGADVTIITRLADDDFGKMAKQTWQNANVKGSIKYSTNSYTGAAFIFIDDKTGDNAIIIAPGAASEISLSDIHDNSEIISSTDVFLTQLEQPIEVAQEALKVAKENNKITILNPAPAARLPKEIFGLCDFITPNETETEALTGLPVRNEKEAENAAKVLNDLGVKTPIITMGEQGAFLYEHGLVPAFNAGKVVETTGAGDAFNGGFAVALSEGKSALEAVKFGCATASISVTRAGTAPSMPARDEVEEILST